MSQSKNRQNRRGPASEAEHPLPHPVERHGRGTAIAIAAAVVILILAIVGIVAYPTYIAPFRKSIITVDDVNISMSYFLKRMKVSGADPLSLLTTITNEQIIRLGAPGVGISASADEIDKTLRAMFQGQSDNVSADSPTAEAEFREWYRQSLNESGLTDAEYRDIIATEVMRSKLQQTLETRMSTVAEQAHVYLITVETQKEAERARARWAAGENFTALARELSLDTQTGQNGGELGWFPRGGILIPQLEFEAFELATGNVSQPIPIFQDLEQPDGGTAPTVVAYQLMLVTERAVRELDDLGLRAHRARVVDDWLSAERQNHVIKWRGINGDSFDNETYAWLNYQASRSKPSSGGE